MMKLSKTWELTDATAATFTEMAAMDKIEDIGDHVLIMPSYSLGYSTYKVPMHIQYIYAHVLLNSLFSHHLSIHAPTHPFGLSLFSIISILPPAFSQRSLTAPSHPLSTPLSRFPPRQGPLVQPGW